MIYELTEKAEQDGVGKAGDRIEPGDDRLSYFLCHRYVVAAQKVKAEEKPNRPEPKARSTTGQVQSPSKHAAMKPGKE